MPAWSPEKVHRKIGDMVTDLMANADWMKDRFNNDFTPTIQTATAFPVTSAYRPDLPEVSRERYDRVQDFGPRWNENSGGRPMTSLKGYGWLGLMPTHSGGVMSEFSASAPVDRSDLSKGYMNFPQVVPTLNRSEVDYLLKEPQGLPGIPAKDRAISDSVYQKAYDWANARRLQGLDPFID